MTKDTRLLTKEGYKPLWKIFEETGNPAYKTTKKPIEAKVELINRYGEVEPTTHITFNGLRKVLKVTTRTGTEQTITYNHPLLVLREGVMQWVNAEDLKVGDPIVTRLGDEVYGDNSSIDKEEAYILGLLIADGTFEKERISFSNNEEVLLNKVKDYLEETFGKESRVYNKKGSEGTYDLILSDYIKVPEWYKRLGLKPMVSKDKYIPEAIMEGSKEVQLSFLSGYIECDSSFYRGEFELSSASKRLLEETKLLLKNMGIVTILNEKKVKGYEHNWYGRLTNAGESTVKLLNLITLVTDTRRNQKEVTIEKARELGISKEHSEFVYGINHILRAYYKTSDTDSRSRETTSNVPRVDDNVSKWIARQLLESVEGDDLLREYLYTLLDDNIMYDEVKSIEDVGKEYTYDVTMERTSSFIAESNVNHNSSLAMTLTKNAQDMGIPIFWIDVEGTTTAENMRNFGIDPSKDIFTYQPDEGDYITIEDVTDKIKEIADLFKETNRPLLIIWDSLAQTTPEKFLKKDFNMDQPGVLAKSISNMTTKIGQTINQTNIGFIIINQARDDMNSSPMFPQIKSSGGRALEHWSTLRLEVTKGRQIKEKEINPLGKEEEVYVGHIFRVKTEKSKVSTPNRKTEVYLISSPYVGIDLIENIYRSAVDDYGLISKGAWRKYQTLGGEEISLRDKEWVPFLQDPENIKILTELYIRELVTFFPEHYPAMGNKNSEIASEDNHLMQVAEKYYNEEDISGYLTGAFPTINGEIHKEVEETEEPEEPEEPKEESNKEESTEESK